MTGTINANETLNGGVEAIPTLSGTLSGNTTSSYNSLSDKPIINGTTLEGGVDRSLVEDVKVNGVSVVNEEHIAEIECGAEDIPYDNSDSQAQSTDVQGALDEAFQRTIDIGTWFTDVVAERYNYIKHYTVGDYVFNFPSSGVIKLYRCISDTSGAWDSTKWEEVKLSNEVSDEVTLREELESATKVYGTPKNLPQPIATFTDGANLPMPSLKTTIVPIQEGSGDPSPSNVRPISGWSGANVSVCGVNVWDEEWEVGGLNPLNGETTSENDRIRSKNYRPCKPNMTMFCYIPSGKGNLQIVFYDINKNYLGYYNFTTEHTFTTPNVCCFFKFNTGGSYGTTYNNDISINYPSTDTEYHAYNGQTYTIPFTDSQGNPITVYGGSLDVVSGVLTVDRGYADLGSLSWIYSQASGNRSLFTTYDLQGLYKSTGSNNIPVNAICEKYKNEAMETTFVSGQFGLDGLSSARLIICDNSYTDETSFKTAVTGQKLVYELATPTTIQLTPTAVKSLLGSNNVWADCGQIKDLKYVRNLNITINDLISRVEALEG